VQAVLEIAASDIEPPPSFGAKIRVDFIEGIGKVNGKFVILLNVNNALSMQTLDQAAPAIGAGTPIHVETTRSPMNSTTTPSSVAAKEVGSVLARFNSNAHALVQILHELQELQGWLSPQALRQVAAALSLTLAHVQGVVGFYRFFHTRPVGAYRVLFSDNVTGRAYDWTACSEQLWRWHAKEKVKQP
jgi:hypothetical protein